MTASLLDVRGLRKYFPIAKGIFSRVTGHVRAVDDVSFTVQEGETLAQIAARVYGNPEFRIGDRPVGPGHPCYVIAEAGSNHNRDLATARKGDAPGAAVAESPRASHPSCVLLTPGVPDSM